jgi:hypothetical protein
MVLTDLDMARIVEQNITTFDVSMNDVLAMEIEQTLCHLNIYQ